METPKTELGNVRPLRQDADARRAWTRLRDATPEEFHGAWLAVQCSTIVGVRAGVVLAPPPQGGAFQPVATWPPERRPGAGLLRAAGRVLQERRALALELEPRSEAGAPAAATRTIVAQPVEAGGELVAAVVLEVEPRPQPELELALRQLSWGAAWLELHAERAGGGRGERLEALLTLVGSAAEHEHFRGAATAFATELATHLGCQRVSLGFADSGRVRLEAVSHSAHFARRANLTRAIEAAMDEALDQECEVLYPEVTGAAPRVTRYHAELARQAEAGALCSVPFARGARFAGVITLERSGEAPFTTREIELVKAAAGLAGAPLSVYRRDDRWIGAKLRDAAGSGVAKLVGPRHVALKLWTSAALLLLGFLALAHGDYRVTADMRLEARELRAAVAPFDGYIALAPVRAGDLVTGGELLASLDDRELRLEAARATSHVEQLSKQYRQALSERDAAEVAILTAQLDQARAQLALAQDQLKRTRIEAPFDGVVIEGDLSQELGAPVQRGQVLYEVAPLEAYRVVLQVEEQDIDEVAPGQRGTLAFAAFPDRSFGFRIEQLTPVSTPAEGSNRFRVEAQFDETPGDLRPGMEGVAKVEIARRRLLWIWTHELVDRARLALWNWLP